MLCSAWKFSCTYVIQKVTGEAFIDYFQGCLLTYPYKNMFSVGCFSAIPDTFDLKCEDEVYEGEIIWKNLLYR